MSNELVAALAAIIGAIIGAFGGLLAPWISRKCSESGQLFVFCKFVHAKTHNRDFEIYHSSFNNCYILDVPMWVEIANTSMTNKFILDFNLVAYNGRHFVSEFTQVQSGFINDTEFEFGNHQSYSLLVDSKSIHRFHMEFLLKENSLSNKNFNIIKVRYYNDNGRKIEKTIYSQPDPIKWQSGKIKFEKSWQLISRRGPHGNQRKTL